MTKPHKHAAVIKAWADGAEIQVAPPVAPTATDPLGQREPEWYDAPNPKFDDHMLYRVKPKGHRWQDEMDAAARGEPIQFSLDGGKTWERCQRNPKFSHPAAIYRVAPKPTLVRVRTAAMTNGMPSDRAERMQSGGLWTLHVTTIEAAAAAEESGDFVCWLHDWIDVERPGVVEGPAQAQPSVAAAPKRRRAPADDLSATAINALNRAMSNAVGVVHGIGVRIG